MFRVFLHVFRVVVSLPLFKFDASQISSTWIVRDGASLPLRCQCRSLFSAFPCRDVLCAHCEACRDLDLARALPSPWWLGRGCESGFISGFDSVSGNLFLQLKSRVFESSGFSESASELESLLFPLKGHMFEASGFSGFVSDLESLCVPVEGSHVRGFWFLWNSV